ncbi:IscS subfamily cysteine desulfurase [Evansella sp. LMS18]|uniref:IscS subfamily cysteine desulfurase n=1 Tax=Evansella sp. LMS18 TaxID=2924033 RepID=UPI0020D08361|nr:IscS subfamily cysteine desulfurase [Evansella sp. LMS18]UTR09195.1 IscS subfamily cysteine desulfurase [Evansella sp. LMS18]
MIYLDHAASTPMSQTALGAYVKAAKEYFANTSSLHEQGEKSKQLLEKCRAELAQFIHASPNEILFTSGGTESNLLALQSIFSANRKTDSHVITSAAEHPSVHSFFKKLETEGTEVSYLGVDSSGRISVEELKQTIKRNTVLASIQHVNSETGIIQPLHEIGSVLREAGVIFHSDCVQSFTKLPIHVDKLPVDALSFSGHKIYGPKGTGAVYLSSGIKWDSVNPLTTHESGFRPGTVNLPGIAAFTAAAIESAEMQASGLLYIQELRELFFRELKPFTYKFLVEGSSDEAQLPHIIGMGIEGYEGQYILLTLDRYGICISTGSACQSGKQDPSVMMRALNRTPQEARRFFRISLGVNNTKEEIIRTAEIIKECIYEREGKIYG